jgi:hypothetical protein
MFRIAALSALALAGWAATAHGQVIVSSSPVRTTYYAGAAVPAPVVSYYSPTVSYLPPSLPPNLPPITTYYGPSTVTSYYSPQPFYTYYSSPVVSYYAPTSAYYSPVIAGRSAYGTVRAYVPGQPVRNTLRYSVP